MTFENLRVYQAAELLRVQVEELLAKSPKIKERDRDQLRRAASSIPYNIAEAYGAEHLGKKIYHLATARGSADEVRSILRNIANIGSVTPASTVRPSIIARTIAKMLTAWIETLKKREEHGPES